jgi:outer membrane biosynthesis protein TonB
MSQTRSDFRPALLGSILLHGGVLALGLLAFGSNRELKVGSAVPVTIVTNAPPAELAPAVQAPEPQTAQTEQPVPEAPPEASPPTPQPAPQPVPKPPTPQPKPTPPQPKPAPAAKLTPAPPKPAPAPKPAAKPAPTAAKGLDLDALAASVSKMAKPSSAAKGPNHAATAQEARTGTGSAEMAAAMNGLTDDLQRRWNPNCGVAEGRAVVVKVSFRLNAGGGVVGEPRAQIAGPLNAAAQVGAQRAVSAVFAAAPFRNLPPDFYRQTINVTFNAREACS